MQNIFNSKEQSDDKTLSIRIYKMFKENGEHCQISFVEELECWLVASKNVAILVRNESDIKLYAHERFIWARLIAEQWLSIINGLSPQERDDLKRDIKGMTLIGEYCGN